MKKFEYIIRDNLGIHARPAGLLAKEAKKYNSKIFISSKGKKAEATRLIAVMGMAVKCGDIVEIEIDGNDEEKAFAEMKAFFEENF